MSDSSAHESKNIPPKTPPPLPPSQVQTPGVGEAEQAQEQSLTLSIGEVVAGRFQVESYLGRSSAGISYLCVDRAAGDKCVIKILAMQFPGQEVFDALSRYVRRATSVTHRNITRTIGMGRTSKGEIFVAMEYIDGAALPSVLGRWRDAGRSIGLRDALTVVAHISAGLEAVHAHMAHGVLTPYNVYISRQRVLKIGNLAFGGLLGQHLHANAQGPYHDSMFVAPEVREDPGKATPRSDVFSIAMILCELLSEEGLIGESTSQHNRQTVLATILERYPRALHDLISQALADTPGQRVPSTAQFVQQFAKIVEQSAELSGNSNPRVDDFPIEPFNDLLVFQQRESPREDDDELFNIPELKQHSSKLSQASDERYLVQKQGLDYGPFSVEQIIEQLHADEIDENSPVLDRLTQQRMPLEQVDAFAGAVRHYIPIREERRRQEAQARAQLQQKVKQGGKAALIVAIIVGIGILITMAWFWHRQPDPESLPVELAFAELDYRFSPPPQEFQAVAIDADLLQSIFNPGASQADVAQQVKKMRASSSKSRRKRSSGARDRSSSDSESGAVDFSQTANTDHHLTDDEIVDVVMSHLNQLRNCYMLEYKENKSFRGVTIQFFVRPSGTTGGVRVVEEQYRNRPVEQCLVQRFRAMKFPEHGAINNRGVTYPIYFQ